MSKDCSKRVLGLRIVENNPLGISGNSLVGAVLNGDLITSPNRAASADCTIVRHLLNKKYVLNFDFYLHRIYGSFVELFLRDFMFV